MWYMIYTSCIHCEPLWWNTACCRLTHAWRRYLFLRIRVVSLLLVPDCINLPAVFHYCNRCGVYFHLLLCTFTFAFQLIRQVLFSYRCKLAKISFGSRWWNKSASFSLGKEPLLDCAPITLLILQCHWKGPCAYEKSFW